MSNVGSSLLVSQVSAGEEPQGWGQPLASATAQSCPSMEVVGHAGWAQTQGQTPACGGHMLEEARKAGLCSAGSVLDGGAHHTLQPVARRATTV